VSIQQDTSQDRSSLLESIDRTQILQNLLKLNNRLLAPFSTHLEKRHKISLNEFRVLMLIGDLGTTASHELAERLGVNTMAVSRAVGSLNRHGRISVDVDPMSRRRKVLRLTEEGRRLYAEMTPTTDGVSAYLFEALRADEVLAFNHYVQTLTARLEARDEKGRSIFLERTRPDAGSDDSAA